jgi:hypothetical protein
MHKYLIHPQQVQLRVKVLVKEKLDRPTCLLAYRDKWLESCHLRFARAIVTRRPPLFVLAEHYFFQKWQKSDITMILKERTGDAGVIRVFHTASTEHLDTGELLIEPGPLNIIFSDCPL